MTTYDGPAFEQPAEPEPEAVAEAAPRVRPVLATTAVVVVVAAAIAWTVPQLGLPAMLERGAGRSMPELWAAQAVLMIGALALSPLAVVLGALALRRRESGPLRIGLALGAGATGTLTALAMLVRSLYFGSTFG